MRVPGAPAARCPAVPADSEGRQGGRGGGATLRRRGKQGGLPGWRRRPCPAPRQARRSSCEAASRSRRLYYRPAATAAARSGGLSTGASASSWVAAVGLALAAAALGRRENCRDGRYRRRCWGPRRRRAPPARGPPVRSPQESRRRPVSMVAKVEATSTGIVRTEPRLGERRNLGERLNAPAVPMSLAVVLSPRRCVSRLAPSLGVPHVPLFEGPGEGRSRHVSMADRHHFAVHEDGPQHGGVVHFILAARPVEQQARERTRQPAWPGLRSTQLHMLMGVHKPCENPYAQPNRDDGKGQKSGKKWRLGKKRIAIGVRRLIRARHTSRGPGGEARRPALGDRSQGRSPAWF